MIWCQFSNEEISLDIFCFYKGKQRGMLCQPDDLRHYSDYVCLRNLMEAGAPLFWHYETVGFHVFVDFRYYTLNAHSDSLNGFEIHRTKLLCDVQVVRFYEFLN